MRRAAQLLVRVVFDTLKDFARGAAQGLLSRGLLGGACSGAGSVVLVAIRSPCCGLDAKHGAGAEATSEFGVNGEMARAAHNAAARERSTQVYS